MYLKNTQRARQQRQWQFLSHQLKKLTKQGKFQQLTADKKAYLIGRLKSLFQKMLRFEKASNLKKALGAAALLLGLQATPLQAQVQFAPVVNNPFGLVHSNNISWNTLADLDGDGDLDIFSVQYDYYTEEHTFDFRENTSQDAGVTAAFSAPVQNYLGLVFPNAEVKDFSTLDFGDLDNDGDLDLLVGNYDSDDLSDAAGELLYYENTGDVNNPTFAEPIINPFELQFPVSTVVTPHLVDIDNDGDLDLLNIRAPFDFNDANVISYHENIGTAEAANFAIPVESPFGLPSEDVDNYGFFDIGDIDLDGDLDIISGGIYNLFTYEPARFKFIENIGSATAPAFATPIESPFSLEVLEGLIVWPTLGDLDNDGDLDILTDGGYNYDTGALSWTFHENLLDPVAVKEASLVANVSVFPTVSHDQVTINVLTETQQAYFEINVFDVQGELLSQEKLSGGLTANENINLSGYPAGQYLIQVRTPEGALVRKVVKQ